MPDTTVPVPDDRTAEFYQFFGLWLAGGLGVEATKSETSQPPQGPVGKRRKWTGSNDDLEDATVLWKRLSTRGRAMFSLLMDNPGVRYTGKEIASALDIPNGANGVAGVLAWPGRFSWELKRELPTQWKDGEDGAHSVYWMDADVAALFKRVRTEAAS